MLIGITGGIGSGKSTIAKELARRGYAVYDCDREAKRIIAENKEVQTQIIALLGEEAFRQGQRDDVQCTKAEYNTSYVAQRVFQEPDLLAKLNAIVHPAVKEDILSQAKPVLFIESAILFESGLDALCDKIVIIDAPEETRIARVIARDYNNEATPENINKVARIERQTSEVRIQQSAFRIQNSDIKNTTVLMNDGTYSISELAEMIIAFL